MKQEYMKLFTSTALKMNNSPQSNCKGKAVLRSVNANTLQAFGPFGTRSCFNSVIFLQIFKFILKLHFHDLGFGASTFLRYFPEAMAHILSSLASFSKDHVPRDLWGQRMIAVRRELSRHLASSWHRSLSNT